MKPNPSPLYLRFALLLAIFCSFATATAHDFEVNGIYYLINGTEATVSYQGTSYYQYSNEYSGTVTIPATVTYDGITYSVTAINNSAFRDCSGLTSVNIPNSVITIDGGAFDGCSGLTSITIPNSVTSIGDYAFSICSGLTSIIVENDNPYYDSRNNCNAIIETATNTLVTGCMNTVIPNSVTSIGQWAFSHSIGLTSLEIPLSVTTIGNAAFYGCSGLTSVTIPNSVTYIGSSAFGDCTSLANITIPNSVTSIGSDAFYRTPWYNNQPDGLVYAGLVAYQYKGTMSSGTGITLRDGTIGIADWAFYNCSGLISIDIPNSVTSIGWGAFFYCTGLVGITIPNSVTSIGNFTFAECSELTSIDIPNSVTSIGDNAFCDCYSLSSVTIPNSVTSIGNYAFQSCSSLISINFGNSVKTIGDYAFEDCISLASVTIPNSVTTLGKRAFQLCTSLTSVTIGNSVTSIGVRAFADCYLNEIHSLALVPPTISSETFTEHNATLYVPDIAMDAYQAADYWNDFTNMVGIPYTFEIGGTSYRATTMNTANVIANLDMETLYTGDVVIPDSVTYEEHPFEVTGIADNAFDGCYELTSVVIGDNIETIGEQAFQGCTGLTSVTIGSGVTNIEAKAFNYCNALATVKCLGSVPPVMASADCFSTAAYNRATLLVPRNSEETYTAADYWYKFANIEGWGSAGMGDVDGDGKMSIKDVTVLIDALLGLEPDSFYFESADLNHNGRLDIGDVTTLIDNLLFGF
ncbi:MAG: leucine-rich repeat protein [Muribaculaceae bacterium]|nr:leucine-rich repeat protein [Muribaculaceae bacterium]